MTEYLMGGSIMPLYFNADYLPSASPEYVAWVDAMGTQASMAVSLPITANFVFKLHTAAIEAAAAAIRLYPVMDGFYASTATQVAMMDFLRNVFSAVAEEFNSRKDNQFRFTIRAGLAYGPVVHGCNLPKEASNTLARESVYRDAILLGMPMVQAHLSQSGAPPFGIFVHESARVFAPDGTKPMHQRWWRWDNALNRDTWNDLEHNLSAYLAWAKGRALRIAYQEDRIDAHIAMVRQYFA